MLGAAVASAVFTALATIVTTVTTIISFALTDPIPAVDTGPMSVISSAFFALIVSAIISGIISLTWGLVTGMLLGTVLARVRALPAHAASFFLLGAATPLLATLLMFRAVDLGNVLLLGAMGATGLAVLVGRLAALRAAGRPA